MELYTEKCEELRLLREEHEKLKFEYSENTIVQSMNAMKEQYEELIVTTVAKFKYDLVNEKFQTLNKILTTCSVILQHATNNIQNITERFLYNGQNKLELQKIGFQLCMLSEILVEHEAYNNE